jgi:hypothetical protein
MGRQHPTGALPARRDRRAERVPRKLIWWESEPTATGSDGARIRGDHDQTVRHRTAGAPYYGPVTVDQGPESDDDTVGLAAS